jgi:hypothetical protein
VPNLGVSSLNSLTVLDPMVKMGSAAGMNDAWLPDLGAMALPGAAAPGPGSESGPLPLNTPTPLGSGAPGQAGSGNAALGNAALGMPTSGITPLPFQTYPNGGAKASPGPRPSNAALGRAHTSFVQEIKPIQVAPPPELRVGFTVSKDTGVIQVKMTNSSTGEVVRSFDIKAAELAKVNKPRLTLKGSQIDAKS